MPAAKKIAVKKPPAKKAATPTVINHGLSQVKPVTSWSFSRYGDYKQCPLKFRLKHIQKIQEPKSAAMQKGIDAHDNAEKYVKGLIARLDPVLSGMKSEFDKMRKMYKAKKFPMIVEDNWAFDAKWEESQWNNWAECWVRIKLDAAHYESRNELFVTDWKTGKPSEYKNVEYMEQMELYALAAILLSAQDDVKVRVRLAYVETGDFISPKDAAGNEIVYDRDMVPALMRTWDQRVKPMMSDTTFAPRPNNNCHWCFYGQAGKAKGGPGLCRY